MPEDTDEVPAEINKASHQPTVHKDFRLFMVTTADSPNKLPGKIIWLRMKVKNSCQGGPYTYTHVLIHKVLTDFQSNVSTS